MGGRTGCNSQDRVSRLVSSSCATFVGGQGCCLLLKARDDDVTNFSMSMFSVIVDLKLPAVDTRLHLSKQVIKKTLNITG